MHLVANITLFTVCVHRRDHLVTTVKVSLSVSKKGSQDIKSLFIGIKKGQSGY